MKELSIEEKAKAYDEVYKKVAVRFGYNVADEIFLKESEDERISKFISNELACLRASDEKGSDRYEELTNAIAWLEKWGEKESKKVSIWKQKKYDEQNFNACLGYIPDEFLRRWLTDIIHVKYDKSAWSEEDETIISAINGIINIVERKTGQWYYTGSEKVFYSDIRNWLKSLRPQNTWKPSDEQIIALIWVLNNIPFNKYKEEISELLDQIKKTISYEN